MKTHTELSLVHRLERGASPNSPLFLLVHGRAGDLDVMNIFKRTVPEGAHVVSVQAPLSDPIGGFSWWQVIPGEPKQIVADDVRTARDLLRGFCQALPAQYEIAPTSTVAFGFSQGAGLLSALVLSEPTLFSGLAIFAGFVFRDPEREITQFSGATRVFWGHGKRDKVVSIDRARSDVEYLKGLGMDVTFVEDDVEHKVGSSGMRALKGWAKSLTT